MPQNPFIKANDQPQGQPLSQPPTQEPQEMPTNPFILAKAAIENPFTGSSPEKIERRGFGGVVASTLAPVIDFVSRPQYASARFFDSAMDESKSIFEAFSDGLSELISPTERLSYSDVIKKNAPGFAQENPISTKVLGFLGDVFLDPTTYLGVGFASDGLKIGGKVLTKYGEEVLQRSLGRFANREVLVVAGGLYKDVEKGIAEAAEKGITAVAQKIDKKTLKAEYSTIKGEAVDELQRLGKSNLVKKDPKTGKFVRMTEDEIAHNEVGVGQIKQYTGTYDGLKRKLTEDEVYERAEERILRLASLEPAFAEAVFVKQGGFRFKAGLPFGKQFDIPGTEAAFRASKELIQNIGLGVVDNSIQFLKKYAPSVANREYEFFTKTKEALVGAFSRPKDFPYKEAITKLENAFAYLPEEITRQTVKLFNKVAPEERKAIGELMWKIDSDTRNLEYVNNRFLTQVEADKVYEDAILKAKLNPESHSIMASLYQSYKTAMELEMEAGLLKTGLANYSPRYYEVLADPTAFSFLKRNKFGLSTYLPSSQRRAFRTYEEAVANGLQPELDAAVLYAQRMLSSRRTLAKQQFQDSIRGIYNIPEAGVTVKDTAGNLVKGAEWGTREFAAFLPPRILTDIKQLGESVYPIGMNEDVKYFLTGVDKMTTMFRKLATVAKPSFAFKQVISNTMQLALVQNLKAFKSFDPRAGLDAALLLMDRGKETKNLPDFLVKFFGKFIDQGQNGVDSILAQRLALSKITGEERLKDYAKDFNLVTVLGQKWSGERLIQVAREQGVIRGYAASGERFSLNLQRQLSSDTESVKSVAKELSKFWQHPGFVEDYSRMMGFINGIRMGYSPKESVKLVNKALFDYANGLAAFEKNLITRVAPFYRYPRFAIPLVLGALVQQPGKFTVGEKVVQLFEKLLVSPEDNLTPSDREIFGGTYLIEQPRVFRGFDKDGNAKFNIFNNITPVDSLSLLVYDKQGDIDYQRTAEKSVLAALTPFLKVPLEQILNKNFFTGKTLDDAGKMGDLSTMTSVLPEFVKSAIGLENRVNQRTQKTTTYINPYLAYYMTNAVPALKQFIRPLDKDKSILDGAMDLVMGITPVSINLKEQYTWQNLKENKEIREIQGKIRLSRIKGSKNEYEQNYEDYRNLINEIKARRGLLQAQDIHGKEAGAQASPIEGSQEQR